MPKHSPLTRKATLFCQHCGHASPPTGDWSVDGELYRCPRCGAVITDRTMPGCLAA